MKLLNKIQFQCPHCEETIRISLENLKNRENLTCPNCQFIYPQTLVDKINDVIIKTAELYIYLAEESNHDEVKIDFIFE
ncbi:hypothetical protein ACH0B6_19070 [Solibacillus silvestris]